jgi:hypothetical protein
MGQAGIHPVIKGCQTEPTRRHISPCTRLNQTKTYWTGRESMRLLILVYTICGRTTPHGDTQLDHTRLFALQAIEAGQGSRGFDMIIRIVCVKTSVDGRHGRNGTSGRDHDRRPRCGRHGRRRSHADGSAVIGARWCGHVRGVCRDSRKGMERALARSCWCLNAAGRGSGVWALKRVIRLSSIHARHVHGLR